MNKRNFSKLYDELSDWMEGNDHDGSLEYAFHNDFQLHAVNLWESTGASKYDFSANVNEKAESKEVEQLLLQAYILECSDCNHLGFYDENEVESGTSCMSCNCSNTKLRKGGSYE